MTLHYEVTEKQYIDFNLFHYKNTKIWKFVNVLRFISFIPLIRGTLILVLSNNLEFSERITAFVLGLFVSMFLVCLTFFLFDYIARWSVKVYLKSGKHNDFIGEQTLILSDIGIEEKNSFGSSQTYYSAVEKICHSNDFFLIYIGAIKAIIIPITAFPDDKLQEVFVSLIKQKTGLDVTYFKS